MVATLLITSQSLEPAPASAQSWSAAASLSVREVYDDNINLTEQDPQYDLLTVVAPGVSLTREGPRLSGMASYNTAIEFSARHTSEPASPSHTGQISLLMKDLGPSFLQSTELTISDAFSATERLVDVLFEESPGNDGVITERNRSWHNRALAQVTRPVTDRLSAGAQYGHRITRYERPGSVETIVQDGSVSLSLTVTPRVVVSPSYGVRLQRSNESQRYNHEASASIAVSIRPTLTARAAAGVAYFPDDRSTFAIGGASLSKSFQYTETSISYQRRISSGGGAFDQPSVSQAVSVQLKRTMGERANAHLSTTYSDNRSTGGADHTTSHSLIMRAGLEVLLTRWLKAAAAVAHQSQRSADAGPTTELQRNTLTLTLTGSWGAPIL